MADFWLEHADRIRSIVLSRTHTTSEETVEDACQTAWLTLYRRIDIILDDRGVNWLVTVATHEAWRLARPRDIPVGSFRGDDVDPHEMPEPLSLEAGVDERAEDRDEHGERAALLSQLKPKVQRELYLKALGYSYDEIAEMTGSSYSAVNRRLAEGRARLRASADRPKH